MSLFDVPEFPEIPASRLEKARVLLHRRLGSKVLLGADEVEPYRSDDSRIVGPAPVGVVLCETSEDLRTALAIALESEVPITPRAGGSGRTGGAVPAQGGLVLATERLNRILDLDEREGTVLVEPGVLLADLHGAVEEKGWFYPPDPNSADLCRLAGNVAENAAGPRAFKYGPTGNYVLGLDAYLMGGEALFVGRRTRKGVTGYDLTSLLVGSEGTLAAFGSLLLRLVPKPERVMTLLATFPTMSSASDAVSAILAARETPRCLEFLDPKTLEVMRAAGHGFAPSAQALLLVEVDGSEAEVERSAEVVGNACDASGALEVTVAASDSARKRLWESRKSMSYAVRTRARHKVSEDVVVPRRALGALLDSVVALGERHRIDALSYGHAGDGNLHVNFLWNEEDEVPRVEAAIVDLFRRTIELGGTLSGEHGIGLVKAPYLSLEQPPDLVLLGRRLKATFDPKNLLNPGKIFASPRHTGC